MKCRCLFWTQDDWKLEIVADLLIQYRYLEGKLVEIALKFNFIADRNVRYKISVLLIIN